MNRVSLLAGIFCIMQLVGCSSNQSTIPQVTSKCLGVSYPADTELSILGNKEGERVIVEGGWFTKPQVIVLSSYQKMTWDFSRFPADKLRGIIASGLEKPEIVGVPNGVPVRTVMHYEMPKNCGEEFLVFHGGPGLDRLAAQMENLTGLQITRFRGGERVERVVANGDKQQEAHINGEDAPEHVAPTPAVFEPLIANGSIRPATRNDVAEYNSKVTTSLKTGRFAAFAVDDLRYWESFVVLKPVNLPAVSPGYLGRFIVPAGGSRPTMQGRHDSLYLIADGSCVSDVSFCPGRGSWTAASKHHPTRTQSSAFSDNDYQSSDERDQRDTMAQPDLNSGELSGEADFAPER